MGIVLNHPSKVIGLVVEEDTAGIGIMDNDTNVEDQVLIALGKGKDKADRMQRALIVIQDKDGQKIIRPND